MRRTGRVAAIAVSLHGAAYAVGLVAGAVTARTYYAVTGIGARLR